MIAVKTKRYRSKSTKGILTQIKPKTKKQLKKDYNKLFHKAERLWKEVAHLRDGHGCQVQKRFPAVQISHSDVMQVDHWITRNDHNLFFNPCNSLVVCSVCNASKGWNIGPARELINKIVTEREGSNAGFMMDIHCSHQPNLNWKSTEWLEKQVIPMLEQYKKELPCTKP